MKKVVDNLSSIVGWNGFNGATIHGINEIERYIAGNNTSSIVFEFNGVDSYVEKTYSEDVSEYKELTIWFTSNTKGKSNYRTPEDYVYKIDFGTGKEYYLEVYNDFYWVNFDVSDIDTIDRIRITALHSDIDYVLSSYFVVSVDNFPFDIFEGIKEQLEFVRDSSFTFKDVGETISGTTGDSFIQFSNNPKYLDRYMVIKIDDGNNSEIHQIERVDANNKKFYFSGLQDGKTLLNDYTNANVVIYYPIDFGMDQKEISLPSITLWGFAQERLLITNELDSIIDSVSTNDVFKERQVGQYEDWPILIDCECLEEWDFMEDISSIVNTMVGRKIVWVNGRKTNIDITAPVTELHPTENIDIVPKVQYSTSIEIRRELYKRKELPKTTTINVTTNIME